jgi:hypothetical protein
MFVSVALALFVFTSSSTTTTWARTACVPRRNRKALMGSAPGAGVDGMGFDENLSTVFAFADITMTCWPSST